MKALLLALAACSKREPHDDRPVTTPARALEVRCELGKPGDPPKGIPASFAGKRVWLAAPNNVTITGERGLVAAFPAPGKLEAPSGAAEVAHGLAIVLKTADHWWLLQLDAAGAPHGAPIALPFLAADVGRIRVDAFADTVVVLAETGHGASLVELDLAGKQLGDALDLGEIGIDDFARIGASHAFALRYREHSNGPDLVRLYDGDARAWAAPAFTPAGFAHVDGSAPFGDGLLLVGKDGDKVLAATLDATGAQSPVKQLATGAAEAPVRGPDGAHAYALWTAGDTAHLAQVLPGLTLGAQVSWKGDAGDASTNTASETTIYAGGQRLTCR